LILR
jgi:hypothetical protein